MNKAPIQNYFCNVSNLKTNSPPHPIKNPPSNDIFYILYIMNVSQGTVDCEQRFMAPFAIHSDIHNSEALPRHSCI